MCDDSIISGCFQYSLFASGFWKFDYHVFWCGSLWVHLTWSFLSFLGVYIHVFTLTLFAFTFGKLSAIISSLFSVPLSLSSFWDIHAVLVCACLLDAVPQFPWLCSLFFSLFFLFLKLDNLHCPVSRSLFLFSACSKLPLNPSTEFFLLINFIYFWLRWVFIAVHGLSLVVVSGGYSFVVMCRLLTAVAPLVAEHRL